VQSEFVEDMIKKARRKSMLIKRQRTLTKKQSENRPILEDDDEDVDKN
jgi:hypothetical protein